MKLRPAALTMTLMMTLLPLAGGCQPNGAQSGGRRSPAVEPTRVDDDQQRNPKKKPQDDPSVDVELPGGNDDDEPQEDVNPADERCYKAEQAVCDAEYRIFQLTNEVRAKRGLKPLEFSAKASFVARDWSKEQADGGFISHAGFPSDRQQVYQAEFGQRFNSTAENVAMTGRASDPVQEFVDMWVGSFGHLRNMLGNHQVLGVGLSQTSGGSWYATQIFGAE